MNLPNKITITRIFLSIFALVFLVLPWYQFGVSFPMFNFMGKVIVDSKYLIAGIIFIIASITDFIDGHLARSQNLVTDFGKVMDTIADKILVNGILIILAYNGFISLIVPLIIITRDTFVDSIRMISSSHRKVIAASSMGKAKTVCMMIGVSFMLFYNLPFELVHLPLADILIIVACLLSVISGCEYYFNAKNVLFKEM